MRKSKHENKLGASQIVLNKIILGFGILGSMLFFSSLSMVYVSHTGAMSAEQTLTSISLIEPLQGINQTVLQAISNYKLIGVSSLENSLIYFDELKQIDERFEQYTKQLTSNGFLPIDIDLSSLNKTYQEISALGKEMALATIEENKEKAKTTASQILKLESIITKEVQSITKTILNGLYQKSSTSRNFLLEMRTIGLILTLLSLIIGTLSALTAFRGVKSSLIEEKNLLTSSISGIVDNLMKGSESLRTNSDHLSKTSDTLSTSSHSQSIASKAAVQEIQKITTIIQTTSDNIEHSIKLAKENNEKVKEGRTAIDQIQTAIDEIKKSNSNLEIIIKNINEIEDRTKVINDIVFQTRLLSFNASVEAARAGEQGKGFAVVAEEIGKLAQISGVSANEINQLVSSSLTNVTQIVSLIHDRVSTGQTKVDHAVQLFTEIEQLNIEINQIIDTIHTNSSVQNQSILSTNKSISEIDEGIQVGRDITNNTSAISKAIENQSTDLQNTTINLNSLLRSQ